MTGAGLTHSAGRGRLAEVLATRGGRAEPEAPFVIEHREALIYMLCQAAEIEHGIMCQYLFAAFSLKQRADEGLTPEELDAVTRWRRTIAHVGTEEMRPDLAERGPESRAIWPEYNLHGDVFEGFWEPLLEELPEYQFALYDEAADVVLAVRDTFRRAAAAAPRGERLHAMGRAYTDELLPDRHAVLMCMQGFAAAGVDPEIRAAVRRRFGDMVMEVAELGGCEPHDVRTFFADGMLLNIVAALELQEMAVLT